MEEWNISADTTGARRIYLLTDEFCWVNDTLTDPQLIDSELRGKNSDTLTRKFLHVVTFADLWLAERYPNCNLFVDTTV